MVRILARRACRRSPAASGPGCSCASREEQTVDEIARRSGRAAAPSAAPSAGWSPPASIHRTRRPRRPARLLEHDPGRDGPGDREPSAPDAPSLDTLESPICRRRRGPSDPRRRSRAPVRDVHELYLQVDGRAVVTIAVEQSSRAPRGRRPPASPRERIDMPAIIRTERLTKSLRRAPRHHRRRPRGPGRRGVRLPRPQRRRQDDDDPDDARPDPADERAARSCSASSRPWTRSRSTGGSATSRASSPSTTA